MDILRRKSFDDLLAHTKEKKLNKALGAFDITMMGLGIIIGTGDLCSDRVSALQNTLALA